MGCRWRREWDLNPRYAINVHTISNRAPSTTQPSLRESATINIACRHAAVNQIIRGAGKIRNRFSWWGFGRCENEVFENRANSQGGKMNVSEFARITNLSRPSIYKCLRLAEVQ